MAESNESRWQLVKACRAREVKTRRESEKLLKVSEYWRKKKIELINKINGDKKQ